jgi:hypothetical protein
VNDTYWLRDEISEPIGIKPWIIPIIVLSNAFIARTKPIKGITDINQKYLPNILQRQVRQAVAQAMIWEMQEGFRSNTENNSIIRAYCYEVPFIFLLVSSNRCDQSATRGVRKPDTFRAVSPRGCSRIPGKCSIRQQGLLSRLAGFLMPRCIGFREFFQLPRRA